MNIKVLLIFVLLKAASAAIIPNTTNTAYAYNRKGGDDIISDRFQSTTSQELTSTIESQTILKFVDHARDEQDLRKAKCSNGSCKEKRKDVGKMPVKLFAAIVSLALLVLFYLCCCCWIDRRGSN